MGATKAAAMTVSTMNSPPMSDSQSSKLYVCRSMIVKSCPKLISKELKV